MKISISGDSLQPGTLHADLVRACASSLSRLESTKERLRLAEDEMRVATWEADKSSALLRPFCRCDGAETVYLLPASVPVGEPHIPENVRQILRLRKITDDTVQAELEVVNECVETPLYTRILK